MFWVLLLREGGFVGLEWTVFMALVRSVVWVPLCSIYGLAGGCGEGFGELVAVCLVYGFVCRVHPFVVAVEESRCQI